MTLDPRTLDAATRVLDAAVTDPSRYLDTDATLAAYLVGRGGGRVSPSGDPALQRMHEMAAAFGAGRIDDAMRWLDEAATAEERGEIQVSPFVHASFLGGEVAADRIIEMIERHPAHQVTGRLLVRTSRPEALLALYGGRTDSTAIPVVGELVLVHRDAGTPLAPAEAAWAAIEAAWPERGNIHPPDLLALRARMAVRVSTDAGVQRLTRGPASSQWDRLSSGVIAVIARLVREDVHTAVALVRGTYTPGRPPRGPAQMAQWMRALTWWFELPDAAIPVVEACIGATSPERTLDLVAGLAAARATEWLDRALATVGPSPGPEWARTLGAETKRLREGGHASDAESIRDRMVRIDPSVLDLYDVRAAAELPRVAPWLHGADLP